MMGTDQGKTGGRLAGTSGPLSTAARGEGAQLLTRGELAAALKVSVRTVVRMLAEDELPCMRLRGSMVRFYLPDVIRGLAATAGTRKRGPGKMTNEGVRP